MKTVEEILKQREYVKKYGKSEKGKITRKKAVKKYLQSSKGKETYKKRYRELRKKLIELLGSKCSNSECKTIIDEEKILLDIHHKNGGGKEDRKKHTITIYLYYLKNPEIAKQKLDLLCKVCHYYETFS